VREAARPRYEPGAPLPTEVPTGSVEVARRGHLRMLTAVQEPMEPVAPVEPTAPESDDLFFDFDE